MFIPLIQRVWKLLALAPLLYIFIVPDPLFSVLTLRCQWQQKDSSELRGQERKVGLPYQSQIMLLMNEAGLRSLVNRNTALHILCYVLCKLMSDLRFQSEQSYEAHLTENRERWAILATWEHPNNNGLQMVTGYCK